MWPIGYDNRGHADSKADIAEPIKGPLTEIERLWTAWSGCDEGRGEGESLSAHKECLEGGEDAGRGRTRPT